MSANPFMPGLSFDFGGLSKLLDNLKRAAQRAQQAERTTVEVDVPRQQPQRGAAQAMPRAGGMSAAGGSGRPGPGQATGAAGAGRNVAGRAAGGAGPTRAADEERTQRARWIPSYRLPQRIRWGQTPATRYTANGTPFLRVPLGGKNGAPGSIRTITPSSPGWVIPARLVVEDDEPGASGTSSAARSTMSQASPASSPAGRTVSAASLTAQPGRAQVIDRRRPVDEAQNEQADAATVVASAPEPVELPASVPMGVVGRFMARLKTALFGGSSG